MSNGYLDHPRSSVYDNVASTALTNRYDGTEVRVCIWIEGAR